jgi:hypothetical protein
MNNQSEKDWLGRALLSSGNGRIERSRRNDQKLINKTLVLPPV